jgi:signal transduction histidine kinase
MVVVLAAAGLFVYLRLQIDLDESLNSGLMTRAAGDAQQIERVRSPAGERAVVSAGEPLEGFSQVLTPDGRLLDAAGKVRVPAISPAEARRASRAPFLIKERKLAGVEGSGLARLYARPAAVRGDGRLVVVAGQSLEDRNDTLRGLVTSFAVGGPIGVLLASLLGYGLARAGMRPVEAMRRRAERVSLERSGERLPLPAAHDEVRALGDTLNAMLARLESSFERERRFVADASHELRTPLAVLKTEIEAALKTTSGVDGRESLDAALAETDHLAQLAEDLLLIAHAQGGGLPVRADTVEVQTLLEQARDRFVDRAGGAGRRIVVDAPAGLRARLDPLRLRQALGNLVDNALRHGGGDVALTARRDGDDLVIEVTDAGAGFPAAFAPLAFERFAAGETRGDRGAGLGLAIVRAIAEAHGGSADIADSPGGQRGAVVRLRVPMGRTAGAAPVTPAAPSA